LAARPDFEAERQRQTMLKTVARHRPDMLQLLADINTGPNDGIVLDSLHFKKGTTMTITGQAGSMEQLWKFEANLRGQKSKGFETVNIANQAADPKTKKIKFTITFNYKGFSKKDAVL
jgi:Tfp pilus assembly protein PilN